MSNENNLNDSVFKVPESEFGTDSSWKNIDYIDCIYNKTVQPAEIDPALVTVDEYAKFDHAGNLGKVNTVKHDAVLGSAEKIATKEVADIIEFAKKLAAARYEYLQEGQKK